jgi:hypothetical protein
MLAYDLDGLEVRAPEATTEARATVDPPDESKAE